MSKPLYLSVTATEKLFNLISEQRPSEITHKLLVANNLGNSDAHIAISGLKFLGFLNRYNQPSEQFKDYIKLYGIVKRIRLAKILKKSYNRLFKDTSKPYLLTNDKLNQNFKELYHLESRLANSSTRAFKWLCEQADLLPKGSVKIRSSPSKNSSKKNSTVKNKNYQPSEVNKSVSYIDIPTSGEITIKFIYHNEKERERIIKEHCGGTVL
jgi:hypothetical protein